MSITRYAAVPLPPAGFAVCDTSSGRLVSRIYRRMGWAARYADQLNEEAFAQAVARSVPWPGRQP